MGLCIIIIVYSGSFIFIKITTKFCLKSYETNDLDDGISFGHQYFSYKTGTLWFELGWFSIYSDAIYQTLYIVVRLTLMIIMTTILTASTKPLDLTLGIEKLLKPFEKIGLPSHIIAMMISIALRFIPTLIEETQRIMNAQASRGVDMENGTIKEKVMAILSLIVPLFVSSFDRADQLANAMEARGYNPMQERTRYKVLKMTGIDYVGLLSSIALLVLCIVLAVIL